MNDYIVPGCKVLLTDKRPFYWNGAGLMDRYLGKVVEIEKISLKSSSGKFSFTIVQDEYDSSRVKWRFESVDIVSVIYSPIFPKDIITTKESVLQNLLSDDLSDKTTQYFRKLITEYDKNVGSVAALRAIQKVNLIGHRLDFIGEVIGVYTPGFYTVRVIKSRERSYGSIVLVKCKDAFKLTFEGIEDIEKTLKMTQVSFNIKNKEEGKEKMESICKSKTYDNSLCSDTIATLATANIAGISSDCVLRMAQQVANQSNDVTTTQQMWCCKRTSSIPKIKSFKVYQNKTVVVNFADGTKYHVTCTQNDTFDLEVGIEKCILKKMCGENFKNQIQAVIRSQEKAEKLAKEQVAAQKAEKEAREKKRLKNKERNLRRRVQKEAEFQVALQLKKEELIKKLDLTDKQKKTLNEELSK